MNREDLKELTILFVDDEEIQRMLMKNILERTFKEVVVAQDGMNALEIFEKNRFNLVITDFTMPEMNGWELIKKIQEIDGEQRCVILTANDPNELKDSYDCNAQVISKPFKKEEGFNILLEILSW